MKVLPKLVSEEELTIGQLEGLDNNLDTIDLLRNYLGLTPEQLKVVEDYCMGGVTYSCVKEYDKLLSLTTRYSRGSKEPKKLLDTLSKQLGLI